MGTLAKDVYIAGAKYEAGSTPSAVIADLIRNPDAWVGGVAPTLVDPGKTAVTPTDLSTASKARTAIGAAALADRSATGPAEHALVEWNFHPDLHGSSAGVATVSGTIYTQKLKRRSSADFSKVVLQVGTAGSSLTSGQCFVAVHDATGARLGVSADLSTTLDSTGVKEIPLTAAVTTTKAGDDVYVSLLSAGTTPPQILRSSATSVLGSNVGLSSAAGTLRFSVMGTSQTSIPTSMTLTNMTGTGALALWVALKV